MKKIVFGLLFFSLAGSAATGAVVCAYYKANCFVLTEKALCDAVWTTS